MARAAGEARGGRARRRRMRRAGRDQGPPELGADRPRRPKKRKGDGARRSRRPTSEVEDEEDEHLYHTTGWTRELWIQSLGLPAVLPPPEEEKKVETAIGAARAEQARQAVAIGHAHALGIQHRDLKPSNIMVDAQLVPRILDFGLSGGDPQAGHLKGTLRYIAPEQLEPSQPIDARTDVYALGVILYELLCGRPPYAGSSGRASSPAIRARPAAPARRDRSPRCSGSRLQAIALKAMERDPAQRYPSAREMAADLERFLDGRPVLARPSIYTTTLGDRTAAHLAHIDEWLRLRLIHPHEAGALRAAYRALDARDDDWIVESRALTYPQIALYLGRVPAGGRQPLLLRRGAMVRSGQRSRPAVPGPRPPVRRPEPRRAMAAPPRSQGRRRRVLPGRGSATAAAPDHRLSRDRLPRRLAPIRPVSCSRMARFPIGSCS